MKAIDTRDALVMSPCRDAGFFLRTLIDNEYVYAGDLEGCIGWIRDYYETKLAEPLKDD